MEDFDDWLGEELAKKHSLKEIEYLNMLRRMYDILWNWTYNTPDEWLLNRVEHELTEYLWSGEFKNES